MGEVKAQELAEGVGFEPAAFEIETGAYKAGVPGVYRPGRDFGRAESSEGTTPDTRRTSSPISCVTH